MKPEDGGPSLTVLSGPLPRTSTSLAAGVVRIGCAPSCEMHVNLPGLAPVQAQVMVKGDTASVYSGGGTGVWVNDDAVSGSASLRDGDILWIGPPGDANSVMLQVHLGTGAAVAAPAPAAPAPPPVSPVPSPAVAPPPPADFFMDAPSLAAEPEADSDFIIASQETVVPPSPKPAAEEDAFFVTDEAVAAAPAEDPVETFVVDDPPPAAVAPPLTMVPPPPLPAPLPPPIPAAPPPPRPPAASPTPPAPTPAPAAAPAERPRPPAPEPPAGRPTPAPRPAARPPAPSRPPAAARPAPSRPAPVSRSGGGDRRGLYFGLAIGAVVLVVGGLAASSMLLGGPALTEIRPARARQGETVTLLGKSFSADAQQNEVLIGDQRAQVVRATATEIEVTVPALPLPPGQDTSFPVKVRLGGRETKTVALALYQAPHIARLVPDVAMPGEEIGVEGSGWGQGAVVKVGPAPAEIVGLAGTTLRVRVPLIEGAPGTTVAVIVSQGQLESAPVSLTLGRTPLVSAIEPPGAGPGTLITVTGKGFAAAEGATRVDVGGVGAIVADATESTLRVLVPDGIPREAPPVLSVHVPGRETPGQMTLAPAAVPETVDFRFSAEPFDDLAGHRHALVTTGLGPSFVVSASGGRSAARRAVEVVERLNAAAVVLKASLDHDIALLGMPDAPVLALTGRTEPLLEVTEDDVAAYAEDWTRLGSKGGPVTRPRLALWWHAVLRDLVLLMVRGQPPRYAAGLGAEGKILAAIHDRAAKTGRFGVPQDVLAGLKPAEKESLRVVALRVPATVVYTGIAPAATAPPAAGAAPAAAPGAAAAAGGPPLRLEGVWLGHEIDEGRRRPISANFDGPDHSSLSYTGAVALSVPMLNFVATPNSLSFTAQVRGGTRYFKATWDGQALKGTIASEASGKAQVGTFELRP